MVLILLCATIIVANIILKRNKLMFWSTVFVMWLMMTFVTGNADQGIYLNERLNPPAKLGRLEEDVAGVRK